MFVAQDNVNKTNVVKFFLENGWTVALMRDKPVFNQVTIISYPTWVDQMDAPDQYIEGQIVYGPSDVDDTTALKYAQETVAKFAVAIPPSLKVLQ